MRKKNAVKRHIYFTPEISPNFFGQRKSKLVNESQTFFFPPKYIIPSLTNSSNSFDEFARKWNKPVHEFLLRHIYLESIKTYKMSKRNATLLTFLFSSIIHEFFMSYALRIFR